MLREGMFIAERYEIIEKIGSGGMSEVYKAMDHKLNRFVAIKLLKSEFSEDKTFVSKFRAEAQSAAGLMHSNIVNVYDVGEEEGLHYIVMELVEGITLKKYIERKGRLGIREAVSIAIQVAQGIEAAHKHHIVHRDIKPQNIIISKEGKVKVTDFGIARAASSNTINSAVMGSVHYISPEQARGGYSDEKSDIYSFGVTLFEMLTGRVPFEGDSTVSIALMHIQEDMASPATLVPEIPISVEKIVLKCTQRKTERRYQSAAELIADLKRSLVAPNEDFVVISATISSDGPTRMLGEDEMVEIAQRSAIKAKSSDLLREETEEDFEEDDIEDPSEEDWEEEEEEEEVPRRKRRASKDDEEEEDDFEDIEEDLGAPKKIDKVITIVGIAVAVAILVVTIVFITNMAKSFSGNAQTTASPQKTSEAETSVSIPNLYGKTEEEAQAILVKLNLGYKRGDDKTGTADEKKNVIIEQEVVEDKTANGGIIVVYHLNKGEETVRIDNIKNMTPEEAEEHLTEQGFEVEIEYVATDDEDKNDTVYGTNPLIGTAVAKGETVILKVYKYSNDKVEVPDVTKKKLSEARQILEHLGLVVSEDIEEKYSDKVKAGYVITWSGWDSDEKAPKGTEIFLVVSLGPEPVETEAPTPEETEAPTPEETEAPTPEETEAPTPEETEAPTPEETEAPTEAPKNYDIVSVIDSTVITGAITDVDSSLITAVKCVYICNYTDNSDAPSTKRIGTDEYGSYNDIVGKAIYLKATDANISFSENEIKVDAGATITIQITYTYQEDGKDISNTVEVSGIQAEIQTI